MRQICTNIGIPNINNHAVSKRDIQKAIKISHYDHLMGQFEGSKKLQDIKNLQLSPDPGIFQGQKPQ